MAALRAKQIASGVITGTTPTTIYTVPSGHKVILKNLLVTEVSGSACICQVRLQAFGTFMAIPLNAYGTSGQFSVSSDIWVVLEPGDVLQMNRSNSGQLTFVMSGSYMFI